MKWASLLLLTCTLVARAEPPPVIVRDAQAPAVRELVDLASLQAGFRFDLRYATPNNFVHATLYPVAKAYLHREVAQALVEVQHRCV